MEEINRVSYTQWLKRGTGTYLPTDNSITVEEVEAGVYSIKYKQETGYYLFKKELKLDELIEIPSLEAKQVMEGIETFWSSKHLFKEYGYAYKRGILLYGVPGGGKTSIINLLCKNLIDNKNGVVITISDRDDLTIYASFMPEMFRVIEPSRPIICIIEDIDGLCQDKDTETKLINILDGIEQLENIVYIGTTNYTERLSERILSRPNRFDRRIEVKSPNAECRRIYFNHKLKPEDLEIIDIEEWVKKTEGMTMASLGEVIKSVLILGESFDNIVEILGGLKTVPQSRNYNSEFKEKIGFGK